MSKKSFGNGIDAIFSGKKMKIHPLKTKKNKSSDIRTTIILESDLLEVVKALSYWERKSIRQIITEALNAKISSMDPDTIKTAVEKYQSTTASNEAL
jgi:hypothetical protein